MQNNTLYKKENTIIRVLEAKGTEVLVIDCRKRTVPFWTPAIKIVEDYAQISEEELQQYTNITITDMQTLNTEQRRKMHERYTMISEILPYISDFRKRNQKVAAATHKYSVSRQTVMNHLCLYLAYQSQVVLAPVSRNQNRVLSLDEKNFRWALNKFFYTKHQNSLKTTYTMMLRERYCGSDGLLHPTIPSFYQFRYYYRKNKKMQTYYISRNGIKDYQRNHRPLLGDGVQEYASAIGTGMLDATICDIYLVNDAGALVGRPILTACVDAYSGLCCGYALSWEGGVYSLRSLMLNIIADKVTWCRQFGININQDDWNNDKMPGVLVTDMGTEYTSGTFAQISELGIEVVNLPAFRPELKGPVEKFFDVIQNLFKPHLKGQGVIEPDYRERGAHDYRLDAHLTMEEFERVILRCIIYYNSQRVVRNYPYTESMLAAHVQPYANAIFEWGKTQAGANMISITSEALILTLLPRTKGQFSRQGLKVNSTRYRNDDYVERYLSGGDALIAYNPDDVSCVWLIERGAYIRFELIEERFKGLNAVGVEDMRTAHKKLVQAEQRASTQAQIDLARQILTIAQTAKRPADVTVKDIRAIRNQEKRKAHIDFLKAGAQNG